MAFTAFTHYIIIRYIVMVYVPAPILKNSVPFVRQPTHITEHTHIFCRHADRTFFCPTDRPQHTSKKHYIMDDDNEEELFELLPDAEDNSWPLPDPFSLANGGTSVLATAADLMLTPTEDDIVHLEHDDLRGASAYNKGASAKRSFETAKQWFNDFLTFCLTENLPEGGAKNHILALTAAAREDSQTPTYDNIDHELVTLQTMDLFAGFLSRFAKTFETASRYLSAINTGLVDDKNKVNAKMDAEKFDLKKIRAGLYKIYQEKAREKAQEVSKPHQTSTQDDISTLVQLSMIFHSSHLDMNLPSFAFLLLSLYQFAGRVGEISVLTMDNITVTQNPDWHGCKPNEKIAKVQVHRPKTNSKGDHHVFHHRDNFTLCWYFVLAYSLLLRTQSQNEPPTCLFPGFYTEGKKDIGSRLNGTEKGRSKAASLWMSKYKKLKSLLSSLNVDGTIELLGIRSLNENLSSHSPKKGAVEASNQNAAINASWTCFRAGWIMKAAHTFFDYLRGNDLNDRQVGLQLSSWSRPNEFGRLSGGRPPLLDPLKADMTGVPHTDKVVEFSNTLFSDYSDLPLFADDPVFSEILTATLLRSLPAFVELISKAGRSANSSDTRLEGYPNHQLIQELFIAADAVRIPRGEVRTTLEAWSADINDDYLARNFGYAPLNEVTSAGQNDASNCVVSAMRKQSMFLEFQSQKISELTADLRQSRAENAELKCELRSITEKVDLLIQLAQSSVANDEAPSTQIGMAEPVLPAAAEQMVSDFPDSVKGYSFPSFVTKFYCNKWYIALRCNFDGKLNTKQTMTKKIFKATLQFFSLFLETPFDHFPSQAVNAKSKEAIEWKKKLSAQTEQAWDRLLQFLKTHLPPSESKKVEGRPSIKLTTLEDLFKKHINFDLLPAGPDIDHFSFLLSKTQFMEALDEGKKRSCKRKETMDSNKAIKNLRGS